MRKPRPKAGAFSWYREKGGGRTGAVVNGVPVARQSRDPACAAAQVDPYMKRVPASKRAGSERGSNGSGSQRLKAAALSEIISCSNRKPRLQKKQAGS